MGSSRSVAFRHTLRSAWPVVSTSALVLMQGLALAGCGSHGASGSGTGGEGTGGSGAPTTASSGPATTTSTGETTSTATSTSSSSSGSTATSSTATSTSSSSSGSTATSSSSTSASSSSSGSATSSSTSATAGSSSGCLPSCENVECGPDGCGGQCFGGCPSGQTCESGFCVGSSSSASSSSGCVPSCAGVQCGSDGCGGSCGVCGANETCNGGTCQAACSGEAFQIINNIQDSSFYCTWSNQSETLYSEMYMTVASDPGVTIEVNALSEITDTVTLGQSDSGQYECCFVDPAGCAGYTATCPTNQWGTVPCLCTTPKSWSVTATSCSGGIFSLCQ